MTQLSKELRSCIARMRLLQESLQVSILTSTQLSIVRPWAVIAM